MKRLKAVAVAVVALAMLTGASFAQRHDDRKNNNQHQQQAQRPHLGDWIKQHRSQPPQEQRKALQNDPHFQQLPPETQQRYLQRLDQFNSLPPDRQEHVLNSMQRWNQLTPDQRSRAKSLFTQFRLLPLDRKHAMRQAFSRLRTMNPQQREQAIDSSEFKGEFNDNERELLRGMTQLNIGPAHEADETEGQQPPPQQ